MTNSGKHCKNAQNIFCRSFYFCHAFLRIGFFGVVDAGERNLIGEEFRDFSYDIFETIGEDIAVFAREFVAAALHGLLYHVFSLFPGAREGYFSGRESDSRVDCCDDGKDQGDLPNGVVAVAEYIVDAPLDKAGGDHEEDDYRDEGADEDEVLDCADSVLFHF